MEKKTEVTVCHEKAPTSVHAPDVSYVCTVLSAEVSGQVEVNATGSQTPLE